MNEKICYGLYILWMCIFTINEVWIIWIAILFIMMTLDTIMWIGKAFAFNEYSSKNLWRWIRAKVFLLLILFSLIIVIDYLWYALWIKEQNLLIWISVNWIVWLLVVSELLSAITNYLSMKNWIRYEEQDYITKMLSKILEIGNKKIQQHLWETEKKE